MTDTIGQPSPQPSPQVAPRVVPLILATMASQALLVVLAPTVPAIGADVGASVAAVGQARTVTAVAAIATALAITARIGAVGVARLLLFGSVVALAASAVVASTSNLATFLAAHALVGVASASLLTAGFAGVAAFPPERRAWALGHVAGANALAWIVVNPVVGGVTQVFSWRFAHVVPGVIAVAAAVSARMAAPARGSQPGLPLRILLRDASARRWLLSELLAYAAWAGLLTFVGAFFIQSVGVREATAGWLLAAGAAAYLAASTRSAGLVARMPRRRLVAGSALGMAVLLPALLSMASLGAAPTAAAFCLLGLAAGVRTPASSGLGLDQLPGHREAMMGARTTVTQLGYLVGAVVGGTVIALGGYGALGGVLSAAMVTSAVLILRVRDAAST